MEKGKKSILRIIAIVLFNIVFSIVFLRDSEDVFDYSFRSFFFNFVVINLIGVGVCALIAIVPFKGLGYKDRYSRILLVIIQISHILVTISFISSFLITQMLGFK